MEFKIGDKVRHINDGNIGIVKRIKNYNCNYPITVEYSDTIYSYTKDGKDSVWVSQAPDIELVECGENNHEWVDINTYDREKICSRCGKQASKFLDFDSFFNSKSKSEYADPKSFNAPQNNPETAKYGLRYNSDKIDFTQLSPLAQYLESLVFMYGEVKYAKDNWKKFKATEEEAQLEYMKSLKRHLNYMARGKWIDQESGIPHATHAVWNLNRMLDVYYFGLTHKKDGKDLYHQEYKVEPPTVKEVKENALRLMRKLKKDGEK